MSWNELERLASQIKKQLENDIQKVAEIQFGFDQLQADLAEMENATQGFVEHLKESETEDVEILQVHQKIPMKKNGAVDMVWVGFGIPFRFAQGTYELSLQNDFPVVDSTPYAHFKTIEDVKAHANELEAKIVSPTACCFKFSQPNMFYTDSQGCVAWEFVDDKVYAFFPAGEDKTRLLVASSLAEFFARLYMECSIFTASLKDLTVENYDDEKQVKTSSSILFDFMHSWGPDDVPTVPQAKHIWKTLIPKIFSGEQIQYLEPFYRQFISQEISSK
jgi:hypothetical protein